MEFGVRSELIPPVPLTEDAVGLVDQQVAGKVLMPSSLSVLMYFGSRLDASSSLISELTSMTS